jgi:hypothetical protein
MHVMTTAYHRQANGLVERTHRQLKDALQARETGVDWPAHLPLVLLGLRSAPKEISGISSVEAVFGQPLVLLGELAPAVEAPPEDLRDRLASSDPPVMHQPCTYAEVAYGPPGLPLHKAKLVYVRRGGCGPPLAPAYSGPYRVICPGNKYFLIEVGGRQETVSMDRLKPYSGTSLVPATILPRRGRPSRGSNPPVSSAFP